MPRPSCSFHLKTEGQHPRDLPPTFTPFFTHLIIIASNCLWQSTLCHGVMFLQWVGGCVDDGCSQGYSILSKGECSKESLQVKTWHEAQSNTFHHQPQIVLGIKDWTGENRLQTVFLLLNLVGGEEIMKAALILAWKACPHLETIAGLM